MLDDFFIRALVAGIGVAVVAGPLGCLIVWRRMAYFGDTMAHSALLGVALSFAFSINLTLAVFLVAAAISVLLMLLQSRASLSSDALLGILSHSTLALGTVMVAFLTFVRVDLMGFLFGDILAVSSMDILVIYAGGAVVLVGLALLWRPLLAGTVSTELAEAEGMRPELARLGLMLLLALTIAIAMKLVGALLMTALLIIPAATARRLSRTPEQMAVLAALMGVVAVVAGLNGSLQWDAPAGPAIVVAALVLFLLSLAVPAWRRAQAPRADGAAR